MSFRFNKKVIYLLSSDRWGTMRVSKHHYALELAEEGNEVYFIEPPDLNNEGVVVKPSGEHPSLYIVSYRPVYRAKRYLPGFVYRQLLRMQITRFKKAIGRGPDVVWCFEPYRFLNLKWFKAPVSIFFAADLFNYDQLPEEVYSADFCLGVSDSIVQSIKPSGRPVYFINHGLSRLFFDKACKQLDELAYDEGNPREKIKAGYVGNLMMEAPDRNTMKQVIVSNPDIQFIFWGQYEKKGNFLAFESPEVFAFIEFLKAQPNVTLRGPVHAAVLSEEMQEVDIFWICWQTSLNKMWDGSNSHKMLEYFSTGKPAVSHYMSSYHNSQLIDMLQTRDNSDYNSLFSKVAQRVKNGEPAGLQRQRIQFAVGNTYQSHIATIEKYIQQHCF